MIDEGLFDGVLACHEYQKLTEYQTQLILFTMHIREAIEHCPDLVYAASWEDQLRIMEDRAHHEIGWSADKLGELKPDA